MFSVRLLYLYEMNDNQWIKLSGKFLSQSPSEIESCITYLSPYHACISNTCYCVSLYHYYTRPFRTSDTDISRKHEKYFKFYLITTVSEWLTRFSRIKRFTKSTMHFSIWECTSQHSVQSFHLLKRMNGDWKSYRKFKLNWDGRAV